MVRDLYSSVRFAPEGGAGGGSDSGGSGHSSAPAAPAAPSAPSASPPATSSEPSGASPNGASAPLPEPTGGLKDAADEKSPFDFEDEFFEPLGGEVEIPAEPVAPAGDPLQAQPEQKASPDASEPPKAPSQEAAPEAQVAPTSEPSPTEVAPPNLDPADPGTILRALQENSPQLVEALAASQFAMSKEEQEAFETDPVAALPKLAAKAYVTTMQASLNVMAKMIPAMIERHRQVTTVASSLEDRFYSKWTDIKRDAHGPIVVRTAAVYRQMNPQATPDQMIEDLGPLVMGLAKITPQVPNSQHQPAAQQQRRPQAFVPAAGSPPSAIPQYPAASEWEQLGADGD